MDMTWKPYVHDRLITQHPSGFYVIKPAHSNVTSQPIFCPVCDNIMRTSYDEETYKNFQCCDECANSWVYRDIERWKSGWRPSKEALATKVKDTKEDLAISMRKEDI
jgi:hypothetical protein